MNADAALVESGDNVDQHIEEDSPQSVPGADVLHDRLTSVSEPEKERILRELLRPLVDDHSCEWIGILAENCERYGLALPSVRSLCADLSWQARSMGHAYPRDIPAYRDETSTSPVHRIVRAYVEAYRLRYDFRVRELGSGCLGWLREFPDDALILAFAAFASLGTREPQGMDLYEAAVKSPNADRRSRHSCLAAMWFAYHVGDQPQHILELSSVMMAKGETDSNVFYRRAAALRKLGRFEQAVEDIDRAISMLAVGDNMVHQDYVRERELIVSSMEARAYVNGLGESIREQLAADARSQIDVASERLGERVDAAQRVVSDGLLKVVEILGLFVALIGFLAGSGAAVLNSESVTERVLSMALALVGSLLFFVLLRIVASFRRR